MARCGCAQGACFCRFNDSSDVEWSGTGSKDDPFLATPRPLIIADDTPTLALTLEVGDTDATLSAQPIVPVHVDAFTANGTWAKPSGVTFARVMMIGGGGGGASGSIGNTGRKGGGGGDAGQVAIFTLVGAAIPASATIEIGQGGLGGAGGTLGTGNAGSDGGHTKFGAALVRGGVGGQPLGQAGVHLAAGNPPGQFAVDYDADWNPAHYYLAPGAGGAGEGETYEAQRGGYSHPGLGSRFPNVGGGGVGNNGHDEPVTKMGGGGGGGAEGEPGGDGGLYGGGGGGGGWSPVGAAADTGAGGNGADGYLVVISW